MRKCLLICMGLFLTGPVFAGDNAKYGAPVLRTCPPPTIPVKAAALRIPGSVQYQLWVNGKGDVYSTSVTGDEIYLKGVESSVKKCKFDPGQPGVYRGTMSFNTSPEGETKS